MKISLLLSCFLICASLWAAQETNITVKVIDEVGHPLTGVNAVISFNALGNIQKKEGVTDTNGFFSAQVEVPCKVGIGGIKEGYYRSVDNFYLVPNNGKVVFEPWGGRTLILRKVLEPKSGKLASTQRGVSWLAIPVYGKTIGFDVLESDWVAPYGKGQVADFVFTFSKDTEKKSFAYVLSFSNHGDGIMEYQFNKNGQSFFKWPHIAPLSGYTSPVERMTGYNRSGLVVPYEKKMRKKNEINYIFRVQTKFDDEGNVESALYGKITGEIGLSTKPKDELRFGYWLNVDPHSRSLESTDSMFP